ncbi:MAG: class I SAM-dependent methyltransferase [Actinomycetota bacterium]
MARYDTIGHNYSQFRHEEPTWRVAIDAALGNAESVLNVGAGPGNYEDPNRAVIALEPSKVMIDQRARDAAPCVRATAEALPFADDSFDATMGVLTMHHWSDLEGSIAELTRVAPIHVYSVYEPIFTTGFWLVDYFPDTRKAPIEVDPPTPEKLARFLDVTAVETLWVPRDCKEGFAAASWARPHDYLDPQMQQAISVLALLDDDTRREGTRRLADDLDSGRWHERYADIVEMERADFGYRLVTARRR